MKNFDFYSNFKNFLKKLFHSKSRLVFENPEDLRSSSDNGLYIKEVNRILKNQKLFLKFKKSKIYRHILEHVDFEMGYGYLKVLLKRQDNILDKGVLINDNIGSPYKFYYEELSKFLSPTTLRYLKVCSDLKNLFGEEIGNTAEIGCGYGGQTHVNDFCLSLKTATLFDLPTVNLLIKKYLNMHILNSSFTTKTINEITETNYDLVISNYGFSELPLNLQKVYIRKIIKNSKKGYFTMNSGLGNGPFCSGKLSIHNIIKSIPADFEIFEEEPFFSEHNYILVWGHDKNFSKNHMKKKKIGYN